MLALKTASGLLGELMIAVHRLHCQALLTNPTMGSPLAQENAIMIVIESVQQIDVWQHWQNVENSPAANFRSDIRDPLPTDVTWFLCQVEQKDVEGLFIISSGDWTDISGGTFRVSEVAVRLDVPTIDKNTVRIATDIQKKIAHLNAGGELDSKLVAVTDNQSLAGPFTLIEGNRRSVAFLKCGTLVGTKIFVGVSPEITNYLWAQCAYRTRKPK